MSGVVALASTAVLSAELTPLQTLGKRVFFEKISTPQTQSCSSCHVPETGWTSPQSDASVMPGAVAQRFGNRKPPSNAYIVFSPVRDVETRTGGALWDARANGLRMTGLGLNGVDAALLGPAADQSTMPFTNPLEHNSSAEQVCSHVEEHFPELYAQAWGQDIACSPDVVEDSFARVGLSIVAYEYSEEVAAFASRFDRGELTETEREGFELFMGKATCSECHTVPDGTEPGDGSRPLFTSFTTFNIGVPRNPDNPFYKMDAVNDNLGDAINPLGELFVDVGDGTGRVKTPTLRNVGKVPNSSFVKRYTHNGFFNSLESMVHFYNTRDVKPACPIGFDVDEALANDCWPAPENAQNLEGAGTSEVDIGNLGLSKNEEGELVAFLRALSDDVVVQHPDSEAQNTDRRWDHDRNWEWDGDRDRDRHWASDRRWAPDRDWAPDSKWDRVRKWVRDRYNDYDRDDWSRSPGYESRERYSDSNTGDDKPRHDHRRSRDGRFGSGGSYDSRHRHRDDEPD